MKLSILELGRVRQGSDRKAALDEARSLAQHAEQLGYERFWVAEHHNFPSVVTAATSVVIGHILAGTSKIRVGAGGVMLPNHAPYVIAEQFGTLETLYPGRVDLGLGRAPGTDGVTLQALRRSPDAAEHFPDDVLELQAYFATPQPGQRIEAVPGSGTHVPLWILGSSHFGASLAAELGLPFGFASHFAPQALDTAISIYRTRFKPSAQLQKPYVLVGANVIAAETEAEARKLFTTQQMGFAGIFRGTRGVAQPPIDDINAFWTPRERVALTEMLSCSVIGDVDQVRAGLRALVERTGADELMIVSDVFDPELRRRSLSMIARAAAK